MNNKRAIVSGICSFVITLLFLCVYSLASPNDGIPNAILVLSVLVGVITGSLISILFC